MPHKEALKKWRFVALQQIAVSPSDERGDVFQKIDQPGRRLEDRETLRKRRFAKRRVEKGERAPVSRMRSGAVANGFESGNERRAFAFEFVESLLETFSGRSTGTG